MPITPVVRPTRRWSAALVLASLSGCGAADDAADETLLNEANHQHYHVHAADVSHDHAHPNQPNQGHAHDHVHHADATD